MPFWYQVPIPALDDPQPAKVRLAEWLVAIGGEVHHTQEVRGSSPCAPTI
jgi:hypothetical protein